MASYTQQELQMGTAIEHEHTQDDRLAAKIATTHLLEDPHYYTKLKNAGLEQEGAMTSAESGMDECGAGVAVIKIGGGMSQAPKSGEAQPAKPLTSSGLASETPKPLTSDTLQAPKGDNSIGGLGKTPPKTGGKNASVGNAIADEEGNERPNNIEYGKTPAMQGSNCNSDATDFFGSQISKALKAEVPRRMELIPANVSEGIAQPSLPPNHRLVSPEEKEKVRHLSGYQSSYPNILTKATRWDAQAKKWIPGPFRYFWDDAVYAVPANVNEGGAQLKKKVNNYGGVKVDDAHAGITTDMTGDRRWTIDAFDTDKANKKETPKMSEGAINLKELIFQTEDGQANAGVMEVFKFFEEATNDQKTEFDRLVNAGQEQSAWNYIEKILNIQFKGAGPWRPGAPTTP